jgi:TolB-like protein/Flp pilus assembly protein TadD
MHGSDARELFRFGDFELDVAAFELRRRGTPIPLERRPMDFLILLVQRRHELVPRRDIVERLWSKDVFVDVETGINTAIRKVRTALSDSTAKPAFIETVSGRGYKFIADVEVIAARRSAPEHVRLAVLPFANLDVDPEREYLADGLTEESIAQLGQLDPDRLSVIGRTSTMAYRQTVKSIATIGAELSVDYLVEGSVRGEDRRLRITCKLIRVSDQSQVWSESFDREATSLLSLQRELSATIAERITLRLSPERLDALSRRQTRNAEAFDLYLRGRTFWNQITPQTTRKALEYYRSATELDPDYGLAWAGIADAFSSAPMNGDVDPGEMQPRAREAAVRAVRGEPTLGEAHAALAAIDFMLDWDWPAAEAGYRRATVLAPGFALGHVMLAHVLSQTGRHGEAGVPMRRALELEPLSGLLLAMSSQVAFQARDFTAAAAHARRAILVDPEFWVGHMMHGQVCEQLGQHDAAIDALATSARLSGSNSKPVSLRGFVLAKMGRTDEARDVLALLEGLSAERYVPPFAVALVHAGLGQDAEALQWLERACAVRDVHLIFLTADCKWDRFRGDSRFRALLSRCGLAQ